MMTNQKILRQTSLEMLSIIEDLPTLPDRFIKVQDVLDNSESTLNDLTKIIQTDQATSATLLKIANSSYYNPLGTSISSLPYAISRLGRQVTGDIALSMSLLYGFAIPASIPIIRNFWAHSFAVGQISRFIATHQTSTSKPDTIFMAALLHDIGRVVLGMRIDMSYFEQPFSSFNEDMLIKAEVEHYGIDHTEVGQRVLKQWGLPPEIYQVVALHHINTTSLTDINICYFADVFATKHLGLVLSIEDTQLKLHEGLLDQALEAYNNPTGE